MHSELSLVTRRTRQVRPNYLNMKSHLICMKIERYPSQVIFASEKLESDFEDLNEGKFEDKELYRFIKRAIDDLKKDSACGTRIPKRLWPKEYVKIGITNLWKYDLPNA